MTTPRKPLSWRAPKTILPLSPRWEELPSSIQVPRGLLWLAFSQVVEPQAIADICVDPMVGFQGKRLSVAPEIGSSFMIHEIRIGNCSHSISDQGALGSLFPPLPNRLSPKDREDYESLLTMNLSAASPGQMVMLRVQNISAKPQCFDAVLWGKVV